MLSGFFQDLLGGGMLLGGIVIFFILVSTVYILLKYIHKPGIRLAVDTLGYPLAAYILTTDVYYTVNTYFADYIIIESPYYHAVMALITVWLVYRLVINAIDLVFPRENSGSNKAAPIFKMITRIVIWAFGLMMVLVILDINITPLLAGAGIAGIAVALAAQDMLGNFFGGIALYTDKPFRVGDWVKVDESYGEVLFIGTRSTRIRTMNDELMTVPNSKISSNTVINFSQPDEYMLIRRKIGVAYGSDVELVKKTMLDAVDNVFSGTIYLSKDEPSEANFLSFGDSSLNFELVFYASKPLYYYKSIDAVNCEVNKLFSERGIVIPFPQTDVHFYPAK